MKTAKVDSGKKRRAASKSPARKAPKKTEKGVDAPAAGRKKDVKYMIVRAVVMNIMGNARYVAEACKCKTIMPAHLKAVSMIQATINKNKIGSLPPALKKGMMGGDPVLPSEYFGVSSNRYFDISEVQKLETNMFADSALSRAELPLKTGGGARSGDDLVSTSAVKNALKDIKNSLRVNAEATEMMRLSAELHVQDIANRVGGEAKLDNVRAYVRENSQYAHLRELI